MSAAGRGARLAVALTSLGLLAGCGGGLSRSYLRPDYDTADRATVRRLFVRVSCEKLPEPKEKQGELWSVLARRFANQKRNFIARPEVEGISTFCDEGFAKNPGLPADRKLWPEPYCAAGLEGVLFLTPSAEKFPGSPIRARTALTASLRRCSDGAETWSAEGDGTFRGGDHELKELLSQGISEFGPEVAPYFAPAFRQLRALLDTLPQPTLDEAAEVEKIELGE